MDRFDALQAFVRVVQTGSFTKAAESLHLSKTSVSQLIQQLEARLQVRLLNRTTRKVNVTADGEQYYQRVVRLLDELAEADSSVSSASPQPRGRLRIDVPSPLARSLLIPHLAQFYQRYPLVQLDMGVSDRAVDMISEQVDCIIRGGEIIEQSFVAKHLADIPLGVYAAPAYLQRVGVPEHPHEVQALPHRLVNFVGARSRKELFYVLKRGNEQVNLLGQQALAVDDGNAYLAAGVAGLGVLALPHYMAAEALGRGELEPLFADWALPALPLYLAYPQSRHVSAKLRVFINWVEELLKGHELFITN